MAEVSNHPWYRIEPTVLLTGALVGVVVWAVTYWTERAKIQLQYVEIAVGVLQVSEKGEESDRGLREWAVGIIQDSAPVRLSDEAAKALVEGQSNFPFVPPDGKWIYEPEHKRIRPALSQAEKLND